MESRLNERNDLQDIIDKALSDMAEDAGHPIDLSDVNLAELRRRTGLTRSRLRTIQKNGFKVRPHANTGRKAGGTKMTGHEQVAHLVSRSSERSQDGTWSGESGRVGRVWHRPPPSTAPPRPGHTSSARAADLPAPADDCGGCPRSPLLAFSVVEIHALTIRMRGSGTRQCRHRRGSIVRQEHSAHRLRQDLHRRKSRWNSLQQHSKRGI